MQQIYDIIALHNLIICIILAHDRVVNNKVCPKLESDNQFNIQALTQNNKEDRTYTHLKTGHGPYY